MERPRLVNLTVGSGICIAIAGAWFAIPDIPHQTVIEASSVQRASYSIPSGARVIPGEAVEYRPSQKDLELCARFRMAELAISLVPLSDDERRFVRDQPRFGALPSEGDAIDLLDLEITLADFPSQIAESVRHRRHWLDDLADRRKWFISQQLLAVGRAALSGRKVNGRKLTLARKFALAARNLNVTYSLFDDRPEALLADISRLSRSARHPYHESFWQSSEKLRAAFIQDAD